VVLSSFVILSEVFDLSGILGFGGAHFCGSRQWVLKSSGRMRLLYPVGSSRWCSVIGCCKGVELGGVWSLELGGMWFGVCDWQEEVSELRASGSTCERDQLETNVKEKEGRSRSR